jgi:hypothetical protein
MKKGVGVVVVEADSARPSSSDEPTAVKRKIFRDPYYAVLTLARPRRQPAYPTRLGARPARAPSPAPAAPDGGMQPRIPWIIPTRGPRLASMPSSVY